MVYDQQEIYRSERAILISALVACAEQSVQSSARLFLTGLSSDELQYIAGFLGLCILQSVDTAGCCRSELAEHIQRAQGQGLDSRSEDQSHKMILLLEYLCCRGIPEHPSLVLTGLA